MTGRRLVTLSATLMLASLGFGQARGRLNPVIELLEQKQPVFGLYAPSNRRGRGAPTDSQPPKTTAQLAQAALAYPLSDYVFDGTMEGDFDRAFPAFAEFTKSMSDAGALQTSPNRRLTHPLIVKTHRIASDPKLAAERIGRQLNSGVSGIVFVGVESAEEVKTGLAAMRFKSEGGSRPDDVGVAPSYWASPRRNTRRKPTSGR